MSSAIHQIQLKSPRNQWGFVDHWRLVQYTDNQLYWRQYSFHFKLKLHIADDRNPQLEETVNNFEIINKRILSVAGRMFKPDRCFRQLSRKIWSLDVDPLYRFEILIIFVYLIFKVFVAVE